MQKWLWQPCRGLVFQGDTIWSKNCLIAPSGALYVTMCHYKSSAAIPIFCFSIQPMPRCRSSLSGLLLQYQCNWKQLTEQSSLAGAYYCPRRPCCSTILIKGFQCWAGVTEGSQHSVLPSSSQKPSKRCWSSLFVVCINIAKTFPKLKSCRL